MFKNYSSEQSILNESWHDVTELQKQYTRHEKIEHEPTYDEQIENSTPEKEPVNLSEAAKVFESMQKEVVQANDELLTSQLNTVLESAARYEKSVNDFKMVRIHRDDENFSTQDKIKAIYQNTDETRKRAHDALIDNVNILSRLFLKKGLNNEWRVKIGTDRLEIGRWALEVSRTFVHPNNEEDSSEAERKVA